MKNKRSKKKLWHLYNVTRSTQPHTWLLLSSQLSACLYQLHKAAHKFAELTNPDARHRLNIISANSHSIRCPSVVCCRVCESVYLAVCLPCVLIALKQTVTVTTTITQAHQSSTKVYRS